MSALSHRSHQAVLSALIAALVMVALSAAAGARPDAYGVPAAPVNAPGTDVAAPDQQAPRVVIRPRGTSGASHDQVDRTAPVSPASKADATGPIDGTDDPGLTITLLAVIGLALGLAGVGFASWLAVSRKRGRATV